MEEVEPSLSEGETKEKEKRQEVNSGSERAERRRMVFPKKSFFMSFPKKTIPLFLFAVTKISKKRTAQGGSAQSSWMGLLYPFHSINKRGVLFVGLVAQNYLFKSIRKDFAGDFYFFVK